MNTTVKNTRMNAMRMVVIFNSQAKVAKVVAVESQFEALAQGLHWGDLLGRELAKVALFQRVVSQAPALSPQVAEILPHRHPAQVSNQLHPQRRYFRAQQKQRWF
jgi:hypothetical protein